jgi:hypothetical protein
MRLKLVQTDLSSQRGAYERVTRTPRSRSVSLAIGLRAETVRIFDGLFAAASYLDLRRLPELFCGFARRRGRGPTLYAVACMPQAWAAAAPMALLQACSGLSFDVAAKVICLEQPMLLQWLEQVTVRGITLCDDRVDLQLHQGAGPVAATVLRRTGTLRVVSIS